LRIKDLDLPADIGLSKSTDNMSVVEIKVPNNKSPLLINTYEKISAKFGSSQSSEESPQKSFSRNKSGYQLPNQDSSTQGPKRVATSPVKKTTSRLNNRDLPPWEHLDIHPNKKLFADDQEITVNKRQRTISYPDETDAGLSKKNFDLMIQLMTSPKY